MKFTAAQAVKVVDAELERHGEVGTVVGSDADTGEIAVKMDADGEVEHFNPDALARL